jgi:hypothetical protein
MLLRFQFSNFRSFRAEQELSMVPEHSKQGIANSALPAAAIYGANASGKTNVIMALKFMADAVANSHATWKPDALIPREPFAGDEGETTPSQFIVDFLLEGTRHQYGFKVTSEAVIEEWLHAYPKGKRQIWFVRQSETDFTFGSKFKGENETIRGLTRRNSLFISAAAQNNHELLSPIYRWFSRSIRLVTGSRALLQQQSAAFFKDNELLDQLREQVSLADLGVVDVRLSERPGQLNLFEPGKTSIGELMRRMMPTPEFQLFHRLGAKTVPFEKEQESAGTLAFLALLGPISEMLKQGGLLCIDELDASLHPLLAIEIIKWFDNPSKAGKAAQLIFTAHDTNLLSAGVLRRDQIWFTEKDHEGASHLYPLSDFKTRKQENLERGYLQGRYGAIPLIGAGQALAGLDADHVEA